MCNSCFCSIYFIAKYSWWACYCYAASWKIQYTSLKEQYKQNLKLQRFSFLMYSTMHLVRKIPLGFLWAIFLLIIEFSVIPLGVVYTLTHFVLLQHQKPMMQCWRIIRMRLDFPCLRRLRLLWMLSTSMYFIAAYLNSFVVLALKKHNLHTYSL